MQILEILYSDLVVVDDDDLGHFFMALGLGDGFFLRVIDFEGFVLEGDSIFS